jgi:hypothetical protein
VNADWPDLSVHVFKKALSRLNETLKKALSSGSDRRFSHSAALWNVY